MKRKKKPSRAQTKGLSRENQSGKQLVARFFLEHPTDWLSGDEIREYVENNYRKLKQGTYYNIFSEFKARDFIESRRSINAEYRLKPPRNEKHPTGVSKHNRDIIVKLDFFKYLEKLDWEDARRIHNIRLWTPINNLDFTNNGWHSNYRETIFWRKEIMDDKYQFRFRVYAKEMTMEVGVACADSPVALDANGLIQFYGVLCRVHANYLGSSSVPYVDTWIVKQWHYGRDTKYPASGYSFELSFGDWFGSLVNIYTRGKVDGKVRLERIENPNVTVGRLLDFEKDWERIRRFLDFVDNDKEDNEKKIMTGEDTTCVADVLPAVQMEFALKLSMENDVLDVLSVDTFSMTQNLHM